MTVWGGRTARGPSCVPSPALGLGRRGHLGRRGGGASPGLAGEYRAGVPWLVSGTLWACGGGGSRQGSAVPLLLTGPPVRFVAAPPDRRLRAVA